MEVWKDVIGYDEMYQVSNYGNVKSFKYGKERILKPGVSSTGYYIVSLSVNNTGHTKKVHQLVAMAFLNHTPCGLRLVVNHKDFNKLNNNLSNLEIVTNRENSNQKRFKSSSKYVGVGWHKPLSKWRAYINTKGKVKHLGYFENEYDAHLTYQKSLKEINPSI